MHISSFLLLLSQSLPSDCILPFLPTRDFLAIQYSLTYEKRNVSLQPDRRCDGLTPLFPEFTVERLHLVYLSSHDHTP